MSEILTHVESSLSEVVVAPTNAASELTDLDDADGTYVVDEEYTEENVYHEEMVFDDTGEGAGIEGDLDVEEN
jgi:hypothetical protein